MAVVGKDNSLLFEGKLVQAMVLERIGNGFLVRLHSGQYGSAHYNFGGRLQCIKSFDNEAEARECCEQTKHMMS